MTESADRDGMFNHPRLLEDGSSVVTCTNCGATVNDTDAHTCPLPTHRENARAYRDAANSEAQQDASAHRDQAAALGVGEQVAHLSGSLRRANATIAHVKALTDQWVPHEANTAATHSEFCYQWHPDCLIHTIRHVLEEPS